MELDTEGERREGGAGLEKGGEGALVRKSGVAEHGNEVKKSKWGAGAGRDEGGPGDDIGGRDVVVEDTKSFRQEVGFGVESDERVVKGAVSGAGGDSLRMD